MIEWKRIRAGDYVSKDGRFHILNHPTRLYNSWELHDNDTIYHEPTLSDCKLKAENVINGKCETQHIMNLFLITFDTDDKKFVVNAKNTDDAINKAIVVNKDKFFTHYDKKIIEDRNNYNSELIDMFMLNQLMKRDDYYGYYDDVLIFSWARRY